jgi:hypothetical protein
MTAFLGIEHSATGRRWLGPTVEEDRRAEALVQATNLPQALCRVLAKRGVAPEEAPAFSPRPCATSSPIRLFCATCRPPPPGFCGP